MAKSNPSRPLLKQCAAKAKTMPHFIVVASDNFAPVVLREWITLAEAHSVPAAKVNEARKLLGDIEQWRTDNPTACKTPD